MSEGIRLKQKRGCTDISAPTLPARDALTVEFELRYASAQPAGKIAEQVMDKNQ
jgi:hypothetical protein